MVARACVAAALLWATVSFARADPAPKPVDIKDMKEKLLVFKDAEGGIYVVFNEKQMDKRVFYGTVRDKVLYDQILEGGGGTDGNAWYVSVSAPRTTYPFMGSVGRRKDDTFFRSCGGGSKATDADLTQITGDKAKEILEKYKFLTTPIIRKPYLLARDDRGVYYYVDVLRNIYGGSGHRVFVGKKGALKQMALTDVTSDSAGDVFSTKTGDLRLVHTVVEGKAKPTAQWIRGEKRSDLIYLDLYMNQPLIYRDLGLYKIPGTICGNI
ncbi:MAG: hypothetical protein M4D80_02880 [Myxococcota bacterium]|nr:hypothetical protein [Myxococcota bacterium]